MPEGAAHCWLVLSMLLISLPASGRPGNRPERDVVVSREGERGVQVKCQHRSDFQPVSGRYCFCQGLALSLWPTRHLKSDCASRAGLVRPLPLLSAWMLTQHQFLSLPGWHGGGRPLTSSRAPGPAHQGGQLDTPVVLLLPALLREGEARAGHMARVLAPATADTSRV